jgi:hypothetical protein
LRRGDLLDLCPSRFLRQSHFPSCCGTPLLSRLSDLGRGRWFWPASVQLEPDLGDLAVYRNFLCLESDQGCGENVVGEHELRHVIRLYEMTILHAADVS